MWIYYTGFTLKHLLKTTAKISQSVILTSLEMIKKKEYCNANEILTLSEFHTRKLFLSFPNKIL